MLDGTLLSIVTHDPTIAKRETPRTGNVIGSVENGVFVFNECDLEAPYGDCGSQEPETCNRFRYFYLPRQKHREVFRTKDMKPVLSADCVLKPTGIVIFKSFLQRPAVIIHAHDVITITEILELD